MSQIICHFNMFGDLPDSNDNGRIFGIFLDNIDASKQYMRLCKYGYEPAYMEFKTLVVMQHDQINDRCPDFVENPRIHPENRERIDLFSFVGPFHFPNYFDMKKFRGTKLYVIKNTLEAQNNGWDTENSGYVGGVFTHRCCAEKFLQEIIQRELYYSKDSWLDEEDYKELRKYLPIIQEFTEGVSDPEFEKERRAYKDLRFLLYQVAKDPNHPGRKWQNFSDEDWKSLLEDGMSNMGFDKFSDTLEDYFEWMKDNMKMDLQVETLGLKSKENQLYYAYSEIFRLKAQLEKCSIISKKIYSFSS